MKITELRAKSPEELNALVLSLKKEQFNLRFQKAAGEVSGTARIKEARRTIARAKTLLGGKAQAPTAVKSEAKVAKKAPAKKTTSKAKKG